MAVAHAVALVAADSAVAEAVAAAQAVAAVALAWEEGDNIKH